MRRRKDILTSNLYDNLVKWNDALASREYLPGRCIKEVITGKIQKATVDPLGLTETRCPYAARDGMVDCGVCIQALLNEEV